MSAARKPKSLHGAGAGEGSASAAPDSAQGGDPVMARMAAFALDGEIRGQSSAIEALTTAVTSGRAHHAWIIHGPAGVGKCSTALRCAALLVDPQATAADRAAFSPPRVTRSAELLRGGTHPDIHLIRRDLAAASADRELRERKQLSIPIGLLRERMLGGSSGDGKSFESVVGRTPFMGMGKCFVIDGADEMEVEGQNALLKTLEEPPGGTFIFLVTPHEDRLLPTIRSRCRRLRFNALPEADMTAALGESLSALSAAEQAWVRRFSAGSPGRAHLAASRGLSKWAVEIEGAMDQCHSGPFPVAFAERLAELAGDYADAAVKENERLSKESANRDGTSLVLAIVGESVRRRLAESIAEARDEDAQRMAQWADALVDCERHLRANVNMKFAFAELAILMLSGSE